MPIACGPLVRVEQKNGACVREYIGDDRLVGEALQSRLAEVYRSSTMKLESKVKAGSKEIKKYDEPRSPCQRLLESDALSPEAKAKLTRLCGLYHPVQLQQNVNKTILALREAIAAPLFGKGTGGLTLLFEMRHFSPRQPFTEQNQRLVHGKGKDRPTMRRLIRNPVDSSFNNILSWVCMPLLRTRECPHKRKQDICWARSLL